jgi:two-component system cell cycle response regulator DivK
MFLWRSSITGEVMKILVVEDEPNNMMLMTIILKYYGHDSIEAFTGAEGIAKTLDCRPDLVLMDLRLSDMEGIEATRRIRDINKYVPIIAVSSYSMDDLREDFDKAGFNGFIQKPINTSTLMNEIKKMLALNIVFGASTKI